MKHIEKKWYVIKTVSGNEKKVKNYIKEKIKSCNFTKNIGKIIVPLEKTVKIKNGKKIYKDKIYYPGYIIIQANLKNEIIYKINKIKGVIAFLSDQKNGYPIPIRENEINKMLIKINDLSKKDVNINIPFIIGEKVRVIDGPFKSFDGTLEKINEEKKKVLLTVLIFGRKTPLNLSFFQIEKII